MKTTIHHILGNKVLEYDVNDKGIIIDEREYDTATYNKQTDGLEQVNNGTEEVLPDSGNSMSSLL